MESHQQIPYLPIATADGSHTLLHPVIKEHYHSLQGSLQESDHIYIGLGLRSRLESSDEVPVKIFEMGFGTGLNALLSWKLADQEKRPVSYTGLEAYPVDKQRSERLNYDEFTGERLLNELHDAEWGQYLPLSPFFTFRKIAGFLEEYQADDLYDIVYYDAFSPRSQPELWTVDVFRMMASLLKKGGSLVTYSSKGTVRRALAEAGFTVEKHPGPGRKREVIRAVKS